MINSTVLPELKALAPAGFYVAMRVGFAYPVEEQNDFPEAWVQRYTERGLMLQDPVMHWVYMNSGTVRWSAIPGEDPRGVLRQAAKYGLKYGATVCCVDEGSAQQRSFGSFGRADREYLDHEIDTLFEAIQALHITMRPPTNLTNAELEALRMVKNGLLMKEIADMLKVSEGAVKQRLKNAKIKLKAKTSTHAATMATSFGLI